MARVLNLGQDRQARNMSDSSPPSSGRKNKLLRFLARSLRRFFFSTCKVKRRAIAIHSGSSDPPSSLETTAEKRVGDVAAMQRSVKQLHFGTWEEKAAAAVEIKGLAMANTRIRRLLVKLGVIPSLVSMLMESGEDRLRLLAVEALLELASGTFTNKALMVEAGLLAKLPQLVCSQDFSRKREVASLLFSISSLVKTSIRIASQHIIPFLIETLDAIEIEDEVKVTCLATLYNLSSKLENTTAIISSGAVHSLLRLSLDKRASQGALATLGNLVLSPVGTKTFEDDSMVPEVLIEIMGWDDEPRCQELVAYILMVLAYSSAAQRKKMEGLNIVPLLLEVALLGSPLAQKRAIKMLQWFKDERQTKKVVHSGPQAGRILLPNSSPGSGGGTKECRKALGKMVRQSLDRNMESIVRRANASEDASRLKALVVSSSSKSLPY